MKIFTICICELLIIRNFIRFFGNHRLTDPIGKDKNAVIDFFVDFGELMAAIAAPVLLLRYF
jgi:hypothetical protein